MNPKPLLSLNHFTKPVAIRTPPIEKNGRIKNEIQFDEEQHPKD
jgi:hypothetical protein